MLYFRWWLRYQSLHVVVVVAVVVVVVAHRWDVARPQDVPSPTRGMAEAIVIQLRLLAITPGTPIAGNVIRGAQSPVQGGYGDGGKHALQVKSSSRTLLAHDACRGLRYNSVMATPRHCPGTDVQQLVARCRPNTAQQFFKSSGRFDFPGPVNALDMSALRHARYPH